jgi:hypothetical protein
VSGEQFTADQFEGAIAHAIRDHAFEAVIALFKLYAVQHPREAAATYAAFEAAVNGDHTKATLLALLAGHDRSPAPQEEP